MVTFKRKNLSKMVEKSSEKIIALIKKNNFITIKELSEITGLSTRGIEKAIAKLKKEKKLKRIGPAKGGKWKVK